MAKKAKGKRIVECHQHIDEKGIKFGASHPVEANHNNPKTQVHHERTVSADVTQK